MKIIFLGSSLIKHLKKVSIYKSLISIIIYKKLFNKDWCFLISLLFLHFNLRFSLIFYCNKTTWPISSKLLPENSFTEKIHHCEIAWSFNDRANYPYKWCLKTWTAVVNKSHLFVRIVLDKENLYSLWSPGKWILGCWVWWSWGCWHPKSCSNYLFTLIVKFLSWSIQLFPHSENWSLEIHEHLHFNL